MHSVERYIGRKVKESFTHLEVMDILLTAPMVHSGPLDGGCRILARALRIIDSSGKVITLEGKTDDGWQAEHYGFMVEGAVIDAYGYARDKHTWARRFVKLEGCHFPYRVVEHESPSDEVPTDAYTEKLLASAIERRLGNENISSNRRQR